MAKAAKKAPEDQPEDSILTALAAHNPPPEPEPKSSVDMDALMQKIAALESGLERANQTNIALMTQPPAPATYRTETANPNQTAQSFSALPDPVTNPEEFNKALSERITGTIGAALQAQHQVDARKSQEDTQADALWSRFETNYPELAAHKRLVGLSAADIAADLKNRGVDLNRYMSVAGDDFLKQVADRMKKDFGPMVEGEGAEGDPQFVPAKVALANRTAGVPGGSGGIGTTGAKPAEVDLGSMTKDLQELQKRDGYF